MSINLRHLEILYGVVGAREKFEDMVVQLVRSEYPQADRIRVLRGDGGIDAHEGKLSDPKGVDVFQIKYFPERIEDSQKNQIRESFRRVRDNSAFVTRSWTLCLPIDMSVDEKTWFEDWRAKQADSRIDIRNPWGAAKIEGLLLREENQGIREAYFKLENPQQLRQMSLSLQRLVDEIVDRRVVLDVTLESVEFRRFENLNRWSVDVIFAALFKVTNTSSKAAGVWNVNLDIVPPQERLAERFKYHPNGDSTAVILPTRSSMKVIEFGFQLMKNERFPLPFVFRFLMQCEFKFRPVSEDGVGDLKSQPIQSAVDQNRLYYEIDAALPKDFR